MTRVGSKRELVRQDSREQWREERNVGHEKLFRQERRGYMTERLILGSQVIHGDIFMGTFHGDPHPDRPRGVQDTKEVPRAGRQGSRSPLNPQAGR